MHVAALNAGFINASAVAAAVFFAAVIDLRTGRIPNLLTGALSALCFITAVVAHSATVALLGMIATAGPLFALYLATRGAGLGLGDVKLAAGIGLGLGALPGVASIALAFMTGALFGVVALAMKFVTRRTRIPFGPFIALGTLIDITTKAHEAILR